MTQMNKELFIGLIQEHRGGMYRLAFGILRNQYDAEDAVSETILKAYEKINSLRDVKKFKPWIMQITVNEAKKLYIKRNRTQPVENMEQFSAFYQDNHHELWNVVASLELIHREVIILFYYEQLPIKEIAKILKMSEGTVKSRLYRAKILLKERLQEG